MNMRARMVNVMEEDWDFLIVLDACRYDYFSEMYEDFFTGKLEKRTSPGCSRWSGYNGLSRIIIFKSYISGNPYINSKVEIAGFDAKKHFYKVVDVWNFGWDERIGTVPPREINRTALKYYLKYPGKRFIIHYLQPHAPYLSARFRVKGYHEPDPAGSVSVLSGVTGYRRANRHIESLINIVGNLFWKVGLVGSAWKLREKMGLSPVSPMDVCRRKYGNNGLREAYKENLRIVLDYVVKLCRKFSRKKIVITSDHGELLGEEGAYEHPNGPIDKVFNNLFSKRKKILQEVPWLTVYSKS